MRRLSPQRRERGGSQPSSYPPISLFVLKHQDSLKSSLWRWPRVSAGPAGAPVSNQPGVRSPKITVTSPMSTLSHSNLRLVARTKTPACRISEKAAASSWVGSPEWTRPALGDRDKRVLSCSFAILGVPHPAPCGPRRLIPPPVSASGQSRRKEREGQRVCLVWEGTLWAVHTHFCSHPRGQNGVTRPHQRQGSWGASIYSGWPCLADGT